jgi:hypothetical protein
LLILISTRVHFGFSIFDFPFSSFDFRQGVRKGLRSRADRVGEFGNGSVSWKEEPTAPGKALRMATGSAAQDGNQNREEN